MKRYTLALVFALCMGSLPALMGCDREVSKKEDTHTNPNGTVTTDKTVTHNDATGHTTVEKDKTTN